MKHAAGCRAKSAFRLIAEQEAAGRLQRQWQRQTSGVNSPDLQCQIESSAARTNSRNSQVEATETLPTGASEMPMQRGATEQAAPMNAAAQREQNAGGRRDAAPASVSRSMAERKHRRNGASRSVESQRKRRKSTVKPVSPSTC